MILAFIIYLLPTFAHEYFGKVKTRIIMNKFEDLACRRRSCRAFADGDISAEDVRLILQAALMSPSSMGRRSWQFVVVDDKVLLEKLADAKDFGADFLRGAAFGVVVAGDSLGNDCWIEDCSIAALMMQLQAEDLGIGSCWAQMRGRGLSDGTLADDVVRGALGIPDGLGVLCVIGFGRKKEDQEGHDEESLKWENVHINKY